MYGTGGMLPYVWLFNVGANTGVNSVTVFRIAGEEVLFESYQKYFGDTLPYLTLNDVRGNLELTFISKARLTVISSNEPRTE